jgi:hypothetical protein
MSKWVLFAIVSGLLLAAAGCGVSHSPTARPSHARRREAAVPAVHDGTTSPTGSAAFVYRAGGTTVRQTVAFGAAEAASEAPAVVAASGDCLPGNPAPGTNVVIPVGVQTELDSSLSVDMAFSLGYSQVEQPPGNPGGQPLRMAAFVYRQGGRDICATEANGDGTTAAIRLSSDARSSLAAWIVLPGAASRGNPQGNPADLGITGAWAGLNIAGGWTQVQVSGTAVCTGGSVIPAGGDPLGASFWLHIGGSRARWEHCGQTVSGLAARPAAPARG